jgi:protein-S-isoprenylcysteine O-methyltransferase Ste14
VRILGEIVWVLVLVFLVGLAVGFSVELLVRTHAEDGIGVGVCSMAAWLIYRRWRSKFDGSGHSIG